MSATRHPTPPRPAFARNPAPEIRRTAASDKECRRPDAALRDAEYGGFASPTAIVAIPPLMPTGCGNGEILLLRRHDPLQHRCLSLATRRVLPSLGVEPVAVGHLKVWNTSCNSEPDGHYGVVYFLLPLWCIMHENTLSVTPVGVYAIRWTLSLSLEAGEIAPDRAWRNAPIGVRAIKSIMREARGRVGRGRRQGHRRSMAREPGLRCRGDSQRRRDHRPDAARTRRGLRAGVAPDRPAMPERSTTYRRSESDSGCAPVVDETDDERPG